MEQYKLEFTLEQRDWERLQKLSERNRESMESLAARLLAADLAKIFNKPADVVISSEAKRIRDSFIEGKTQLDRTNDNVPTTITPADLAVSNG